MSNYCDIQNIKQRQLAFLNDTAQFYNNKNRAIIKEAGNRCTYSSTPTSPGCAIGRHLFSNVSDAIGKINTSDASVTHPEILAKLPQWMRDMEIYFLLAVQVLHDTANNWDKNGLSPEGHRNYNGIKRRYCQ